MPIKSPMPETLPTGWLEVDPRWLATLFGAQATGEVRVILGKIQVGIAHPTLRPGQIVEGVGQHAFVPTGLRGKA